MVLNNYYEIDSNGKPLELYALNNGDIIPKNFKPSWDVNKRFFNPVWDFLGHDWKEDIGKEEELAYAKKEKLKYININCQEWILSGFNCEIKGFSYHFSYDLEAQLNFQDTYNLFQNNLLEEIGWTVRLNEEKERILLSKENFLKVYTQAIKHKSEALDHLYGVVLANLDAALTIKEVEAVEWGTPGKNSQFNTENMLDDKLTEIDNVVKETIAQKGQNSYLESTMMEVADMIFYMM